MDGEQEETLKSKSYKGTSIEVLTFFKTIFEKKVIYRRLRKIKDNLLNLLARFFILFF